MTADDKRPAPSRPDYEKWAGLVIESANSPAGLMARFWLDFFKKKPVLTSFVTLLLGVTVIVTVVVTVQQQQEVREQERRENLTINNQLDKLNKTEANITELLQFVTDQKARLQDSEAIIKKLEDEKEQLEPIVNADREVVEAILNAQEERTQRTEWWDRGIGFVFGIVGSLLAAMIWAIGAAFWRRRQAKFNVV